MRHQTSRDLKEVLPIQPQHLSIDIKYSNAQISIDKLWLPVPFFQP